MKTIVFPTINESNEISSNLINSESNGLILVMKGADYIGYIFSDYSSIFYFNNSLSIENSIIDQDSFNELIEKINERYYKEDEPISYKYVEFK